MQEAWSSGVCPCVCATLSFGMGVDKATVRAVAHWGVSQNVAAYYQVGTVFKILIPQAHGTCRFKGKRKVHNESSEKKLFFFIA